MNDHIANIAIVHQRSKRFTFEEEVALNAVLDKLLGEIAQCGSLPDAASYLNKLGELQTGLARACFKWEIPLSPRLRSLVREFDRFDDPELRAAVFDKIQNGKFCPPGQ